MRDGRKWRRIPFAIFNGDRKGSEYAFMDVDHGLVGQLLKDECDELGRCGEPLALKRLTMC
jgi:hypothetical protein